MMANLYFRRFILAWKQFGHERRLAARVINYADDLVICRRPGKGREAMAKLAVEEPEKAEFVKLGFFGGLAVEQAAGVCRRRAAGRGLAGPADAPRAHPGDRRGQLPAQVQSGPGQGQAGIGMTGPLAITGEPGGSC